MAFIEVNVDVDQEEIRKQVNNRIDKAIRETLFMWDINEMAKRTCMGKTFLEEEFLRDPRMKLLERRKGKGKRFWFYEQSIEVMKEIMEEWT